MQRQLDIALKWVRGLGPNASVLELGCGTGWLVRELHNRIGSRVTGIDLSPAAIEVAKQHCPAGRFFSGDFGSESVSGTYDAIVSADVIAHVPDQQKFTDRVAHLLRPGGLFILMTQNPFVGIAHRVSAPRTSVRSVTGRRLRASAAFWTSQLQRHSRVLDRAGRRSEACSSS